MAKPAQRREIADAGRFFAPAAEASAQAAANVPAASIPGNIGTGSIDTDIGPAGHRERLRARFVKGGADAMPDYELLELTLFAAVPRRDTKPLAKALLARFGSFAEVIAAPRARLMEIAGVGEAVASHLKIVEAAALRLAQTRIIKRPALSSWAALLDYCTAAMAREPAEQFRVLFLDRKNVLIADEVQSKGTIDHTPVYPREVVKRALELGASAIILVHNHPTCLSGSRSTTFKYAETLSF